MGYTTYFDGKLKFNKQLSLDDYTFLKKLAATRRMARNIDPKYGVEGEFYVDGGGEFGQDRDDTIIDYNVPPKTQPSLWCQWAPTEDGWYLEWDGSEKFYSYVEWLEYLIESVLKPRGYVLNGTISWQGEESDDVGVITVADNIVKTSSGTQPTPEEMTNHIVWLTINEALTEKLGMSHNGGSDSVTGGVEDIYSKGDYSVTVEIRN